MLYGSIELMLTFNVAAAVLPTPYGVKTSLEKVELKQSVHTSVSVSVLTFSSPHSFVFVHCYLNLLVCNNNLLLWVTFLPFLNMALRRITKV